MTERWWAPTRATLEMDEVVKVIFDTPGDVATALLGAHRAGAAAVETVAKGAVPSEVGLVTAMAAARARFAPAMVESLATAVGSGSYAGLLARDVLDAAEVGALDLFRTCVAKGISPPLAAQRAGAVYGVPMRELGLYTSLAIDSKTNPLALTDAADRAMLTYFDKISKTETFESVSKATPNKPVGFREPERPVVTWDPTEHPRDETGEFIRVGGVRYRIAPEEKTEAPVEEKPPPPVQQRRQVRRVKRVLRRTSPETALTAQAPSLSSTTPGLTQGRAKLTQPKHSFSDLARLNAGTADTADSAPPLNGPDLSDLDSQDLMEKPNPEDTRDYEVLPQEMVFSLDDVVSRAFRKAMPGDNDMQTPKMFRMGYLTRLIGQPELEDSPAATVAGKTHARLAKEKTPGYRKGESWVNEFDDDYQKTQAKARLSGGSVEERVHIKTRNDYHNPDHEVLVHLNPDQDHPEGPRPMPTIDEFVLRNGARGELNAGTFRGQHPDIELDPNQIYAINRLQDQFYDTKRGVFVNRWELEMVDDEKWAVETIKDWHRRGGGVGKALEDHWRVQARDEHGRWKDEVAELIERSVKAYEDEGIELHEPTPTRPAPKRQVRQVKRVRRRAETVTPALTAQTPGLSSNKARLSQGKASLTPRQAKLLSAAMLTVVPQSRLARMPALDDRANYQVYTASQFRSIAGEKALDEDELSISGKPLERLSANQTLLTGEGVAYLMSNIVDKQVEEQEGPVLGSWRINRNPIGKGVLVDDDSWIDVAAHISERQDAFPDIAQIIVDVSEDGRSYTLYGSTKPVEQQVIIEYGEDVVPGQPMVLTKINEMRSTELAVRKTDRDNPSTFGSLVPLSQAMLDQGYNIGLQYFHASSVPVIRFRAESKDHD